MNAQVDRRETMKRQPVFTFDRRYVKFCIHGTGQLPGLQKDTAYDPAAERAKFAQRAAQMGTSTDAYRKGGGDSGYQLFNSEADVRVGGLLIELRNLGYRYVSGGWHDRPNKSPMNVLTFSQEGEAVAMPDTVREALTRTFRFCAVWCNMETGEDGRVYRTDSINLNQYRGPESLLDGGKVRLLVIAGEKNGTYGFEKDEPYEL